jgi:FHA domain/Zinc-ribbon containing domain
LALSDGLASVRQWRKLANRDRIVPRRASGRSIPISITSLSPTGSADSEVQTTGRLPGHGTFFCLDCGSQLSLQESDQLPECPRCGATSFRRDSIFESMQDGETTIEFAPSPEASPPEWLKQARTASAERGCRLAWRDESGEVHLVALDRGWTRIGRSVSADVRLDDPSVSRRHALIVFEPDDSLRVLDDRSLNGVFLNGELVEWGRLEDGDDLTIGRYDLFVLAG